MEELTDYDRRLKESKVVPGKTPDERHVTERNTLHWRCTKQLGAAIVGSRIWPNLIGSIDERPLTNVQSQVVGDINGIMNCTEKVTGRRFCIPATLMIASLEADPFRHRHKFDNVPMVVQVGSSDRMDKAEFKADNDAPLPLQEIASTAAKLGWRSPYATNLLAVVF